MTKEQVRAIALKKLRSRSLARCAAESAKARKNLLKTLKKVRFKSLLIYIPLWFEVDLRPIFRLLRAKKQLYAPRIEGDRLKMVAFRLPLKRQELGISSPAGTLRDIRKVDLIIVPAPAIDGSFRRVGFGKGMYDRFFCELVRKPIVIFIQPFFSAAREKVTNDLDLRGDYLVSGKGVIRFLWKNNVRNRHIRGSKRVFGVAYSMES